MNAVSESAGTAIRLRNRAELGRKRYLDPQDMVDGIHKYIKGLEGKAQLKSTAGYLQLVAKSVEQAVHAKENVNFCTLHSTQVPIELYWPLGIMPLLNEIYSTIVG